MLLQPHSTFVWGGPRIAGDDIAARGPILCAAMPPVGPSRLFSAIVLAGAALGSGCYASHSRVARDGGPSDAGRDAGVAVPDAGVPDECVVCRGETCPPTCA